MNRRGFLGGALALPLLPVAGAAASILDPSPYNWVRFQYSTNNPAIVLAEYAEGAGFQVRWEDVDAAARYCEEPVEVVARATASDGSVAESRIRVTVRREP